MFILFRFLTKYGLAAGSVYVTANQGIWGSAEQSKQLCGKVYNEVPGIKAVREEVLHFSF